MTLGSLLSCLRRFCQGSTNVSFQRSVLCVQERVRNASCGFFLEMMPKNACFKIAYLPSLQWKLDAILTPPDWSLMLGKKTWKPGENLVKTWWISKSWWKSGAFPKTWWTPGYFQNLMETWWICKTWWNLGECQNLVKTWWKLGEFAKFSPNQRKKHFVHWRILVKRLLHSTPEIV